MTKRPEGLSAEEEEEKVEGGPDGYASVKLLAVASAIYGERYTVPRQDEQVLSCLTPCKKSSTGRVHLHLLHKTDNVESDLLTETETAVGRGGGKERPSCWASEIW